MSTTKGAQHAQCCALIRTWAEEWMSIGGIWFGTGCRMQGTAQAGMANG